MSNNNNALALMFLTVFAAACANNSTSGPGATGPSAAQQADVGSTVTDEVETEVNSVLVGTTISPSFARSSNDGLVSATIASAISGCVAPSSTTDTDGDGVPDDATFAYTNPPCVFTNGRGGTVGLTGTLRIQDPTPAGAGFGYSSTLTDLAFAYTSPTAARTYTVTRNGTRTVTGSASALSLASNLTVQRTFGTGTSASIAKQWTVSFTPASGATLVRGQPLPSGALSVAGTYNWTRGAETFSLTVSTPTPLAYDASCTQPQAFTGGELRAAGSFDGVNGYLRIRWSACGTEPSIVFIAI